MRNFSISNECAHCSNYLALVSNSHRLSSIQFSSAQLDFIHSSTFSFLQLVRSSIHLPFYPHISSQYFINYLTVIHFGRDCFRAHWMCSMFAINRKSRSINERYHQWKIYLYFIYCSLYTERSYTHIRAPMIETNIKLRMISTFNIIPRMKFYIHCLYPPVA